MMTSFIITLCLTILGLFVIALVPVGAATNEKTLSQTAADAAALGGAEAIRLEWVDVHTRPVLLRYRANPGRFIRGGSGMLGAQGYALRNGARVTSYRVSPARGQVYAAVENNRTTYEDSGRARSEATSEMDINFRACRWFPPVPPPRPWNGGPTTFPARMTCGDWSASYLVDNSAPQRPTISYLGTSRFLLYRALEPRLIE